MNGKRDGIGLQLGVSGRAGRIAGSLAVLAVLALGGSSLASLAKQGAGQSGAKQQRFDMLVREDFFAGFAGDAEALERGMRKCNEELAKDPQNAEVLVWHGAGLSYSAKKEFMAGNIEKGREIQARGMQEMNEAVGRRPDDVAVLIPRGSVLLSAALHVPSPEVAKRDFQIAVGDYEKILQLQTSYLADVPVHAKGELLGGLAEGWNGLGEMEKSRGYLRLMIEELPGTAYSRRAQEVLDGGAKTGTLGTTCLSCHVTGPKK
jgi:hypothetical protein